MPAFLPHGSAAEAAQRRVYRDALRAVHLLNGHDGFRLVVHLPDGRGVIVEDVRTALFFNATVMTLRVNPSEFGTTMMDVQL